MLTKEIVKEALSAALAAPVAATGPRCGCGRAYVCVSGSKEVMKALEAAAKSAGVLFLKKAYGVSGPALYMGYDNGSGAPYAKAEAVAAELSKRGLSAYADGASD